MSVSPLQSAAPPQRRRWPRRLLVLLLIFVGLPAGYYAYTRWTLAHKLAEVTAEIDRSDPRWRLEDIDADRKSIPDEENAALQIMKVARLIGKNHPADDRNYQAIFEGLPPQAQLNEQQIEHLRTAFEKMPDALLEARKLKEMPHGRFPIQFSLEWYLTRFTNHHDVTRINLLLEHDAMLRAQQGELDQALDSCLAILNGARSCGDEPTLISFFIHLNGLHSLTRTVERCLAQGQAGEVPLRALQDRLGRERGELGAHFVQAVRGERAGHHRFFDALYRGRIRFGEHLSSSLRARIGLRERIADHVPTLITKDYPNHLRHLNELVAAAGLPLKDQVERFKALEKRVDRRDQWYEQWEEILPLAPPNLTNSCVHHLRTQAYLAATEAGIACERFRLEHQRWPESLEELVTAGKLKSVPSDPFDGQRLRFVRTKDGVSVYCTGPDMKDDGGNFDRAPQDLGIDLGFRLWDPPHRRRPPRPPVALKE